MKRINRKEFLDFLLKETKNIEVRQSKFTGKNIYFLLNKDVDDGTLIETYQIEFIPASNKYFFTILIRGLYCEADSLHVPVKKYLASLDLGRNIILDTEHIQSII